MNYLMTLLYDELDKVTANPDMYNSRYRDDIINLIASMTANEGLAPLSE
jgi:hypothetical protein